MSARQSRKRSCEESASATESRKKQKAMKKWTQQEDQKLLELVKECYKENERPENIWWDNIGKKFPGRSAKQCRERYTDVLFPENIKRPWRSDELAVVFNMHTKIGNSWRQIADQLPGRTAGNVKNIFNSSQRKVERLSKLTGKPVPLWYLVEEKMLREIEKGGGHVRVHTTLSDLTKSNANCTTTNGNYTDKVHTLSSSSGRNQPTTTLTVPEAITSKNEELKLPWKSTANTEISDGSVAPRVSDFWDAPLGSQNSSNRTDATFPGHSTTSSALEGNLFPQYSGASNGSLEEKWHYTAFGGDIQRENSVYSITSSNNMNTNELNDISYEGGLRKEYSEFTVNSNYSSSPLSDTELKKQYSELTVNSITSFDQQEATTAVTRQTSELTRSSTVLSDEPLGEQRSILAQQSSVTGDHSYDPFPEQLFRLAKEATTHSLGETVEV